MIYHTSSPNFPIILMWHWLTPALECTRRHIYNETSLVLWPACWETNKSCFGSLCLQLQQFVVVFCTGCLCKHFHSPSVLSLFLSLQTLASSSGSLLMLSTFPVCCCALTALSLSQQSPKHPAHFKKKCVCWWPIKTSRWWGLGSVCQNGRAQVREIYIFLFQPWRSVFVFHA